MNLILRALLLTTLLSACTSQQSPKSGESLLRMKAEKAKSDVVSYQEKNGLVVIEAENFSSQVFTSKRAWYIFNALQRPLSNFADPDLPHLTGASNGGYIENLPDTRTNHYEALRPEENFYPNPGSMAILSYSIYFHEPGRYYLWGRAYSTGLEDNGFHFGLDGVWQESSQRLQLCEGKHQWTWSSQQRRNDNHCGTPNTLWIDVESSGQHNLMLSMREDGAELDKIILSKDVNFVPKGKGPAETIVEKVTPVEKTHYLTINHYYRILTSTGDFKSVKNSPALYYADKNNDVLAINAGIPEQRNHFAKAVHHIDWQDNAENYIAKLVTLSELDGESHYQVLLNDKIIAEFTNPETKIDYSENVFDIGNITLKPNDVLSVTSNAVTNGKIPEGDITAYARGRWRGIVLQKIEAM